MTCEDLYKVLYSLRDDCDDSEMNVFPIGPTGPSPLFFPGMSSTGDRLRATLAIERIIRENKCPDPNFSSVKKS